MRISTISSTTVSTVVRVIDCVTVAGIAARDSLHLAMKREHGASKAKGYWLERFTERLQRSAAVRHPSSTARMSNLLNYWQLLGTANLAVCPAPARPVFDHPRQG